MYDAEMEAAARGASAGVNSPATRYTENVHIFLDNQAAVGNLLPGLLPVLSPDQASIMVPKTPAKVPPGIQLYSIQNDQFTKPPAAHQETFLSWWKQTSFFKKEIGVDPTKLRKRLGVPVEQFWFNPCHAKTPWEAFTEFANATTGVPFVRCNRCDKLIQHPYHRAGGKIKQGTSILTMHLKSARCTSMSAMPETESNSDCSVRNVFPKRVGHTSQWDIQPHLARQPSSKSIFSTKNNGIQFARR